MNTINPDRDSAEMAIINAVITAVAQYVNTKHQIPLATVVSGMSMSNHIIPAVQISLAAFADRAAQKAAEASAAATHYVNPEIVSKKPKGKPEPIVNAPPIPAPVPAPEPDLPPHPVYAMANATLVTVGKPEAIPSSFVATPSTPPVVAPVTQEETTPDAPAKKRGRPKKTA